MKLMLIGCGCGRGTLTREARAAIESAQLLVSVPRLLEEFPEAAERKPARSAKEILEALQQADGRDTAILFSGDSGFYSGAGTLSPNWRERRRCCCRGFQACRYYPRA